MEIVKPIIILFGQPGSGKTTIADALVYELNRNVFITSENVDGDVIRQIFKNNNYTREGRIQNLNRISDISVYLSYLHVVPVVSAVYPYKEAREYLNGLHKNIIWVYLEYDGERGREEYHVKDFDIPSGSEQNLMKINTSKTEINETVDKICSFYRSLSDFT